MLHFGGTDGVGAPAPSCGGGRGGVAPATEIIECVPVPLLRRTARPPSVPPPQGEETRRDDLSVNARANGARLAI